MNLTSLEFYQIIAEVIKQLALKNQLLKLILIGYISPIDLPIGMIDCLYLTKALP